MKVRSSKLMAVLTAVVLTLASGSIQAYASLCQPAPKPVQDSCCPDESQGMKTEDCAMEGCDCTVDSQPTSQDPQPDIILSKAPSWIVHAIIGSERAPAFYTTSFRSDPVVALRYRGPPKEPELSGHGLRAPPAPRA